MINKDTIQDAMDGKYSNFADVVKSELQNKVANHDISVDYQETYDNIQNNKSIYMQITNPPGSETGE